LLQAENMATRAAAGPGSGVVLRTSDVESGPLHSETNGNWGDLVVWLRRYQGRTTQASWPCSRPSLVFALLGVSLSARLACYGWNRWPNSLRCLAGNLRPVDTVLPEHLCRGSIGPQRSWRVRTAVATSASRRGRLLRHRDARCPETPANGVPRHHMVRREGIEPPTR
jgi:hypothetical protein